MSIGIPQFSVSPIDPKTGQWNREWWLFLNRLWVQTVQSPSDFSVDGVENDLTGLDASVSNLNKKTTDLAIALETIQGDPDAAKRSDVAALLVDVGTVLQENQDAIERLNRAVQYLRIENSVSDDPIRSMAYQDSGNVRITGGAITGTSIDSSPIGASTPDSGAFTKVTLSGSTFSGIASAASNSGALERITDVGYSTGSIWLSNGTRWKPLSGILKINETNTRQNVAAGSSETIVAQYLLPAAFLTTNDRLQFWLTFSKNGTTDTGTITFRVGTAGTTADTSVFSGTAFNAASRVIGAIHGFKIASATSLQHLGTAGVGPMNGSYIGVNATAYPSAVAISNVSNALYLTITVTPGATDDIALEDASLFYMPAL